MAIHSKKLEIRKRRVLDFIRQERFADAERGLALLTRQLPCDPVIWLELGRVQLALGNLQAAAGSLQKAIDLNPESVDAFYLLGMALGQLGDLTEARRSLEHALSLDPVHVEARIALGISMQLAGDQNGAIACLEQVYMQAPDHVELNVRLGAIYAFVNKIKSRSYFKHALALDPAHPEAVCGLASLHIYEGNAAEAYRLLYPVLKSRPVNLKAAVAFANTCRPLCRCDEAITLLEDALQENHDVDSLALANFTLGRLYDAQGKFEQAFRHYNKGNALANRQYSPWEDAPHFKGLISTMNTAFFARTPRAKKHSGYKRPVFIVGMPRSGTTLVEQILSSHPEVWGGGELTELGNIVVSLPSELGDNEGYPSCLARITSKALDGQAMRYLRYLSDISPAETSVVVDKMPDNFRFLGFIQLLFPDARIIHCKRDPIDTCLSGYFQYFSGGHLYSYDLQNIGMYYRMYERLMEHWDNVLDIPILEVQYEELVQHQESISRSMLEFCGLEWSSRCLQYFKETRNVVTASYDQVRQPVYSRSVGRWKHYEKYLKPLHEGLSRKIIQA